MKLICLSIVLYCCVSLCGHANPIEEPEAILLNDIKLQESETLIKAQLFDPQKKKVNTKEITLIGQVRAVSHPSQKDSKIVQVVWTGVKGKDKKRASFKEFLISTFKNEGSLLSKGLRIFLYGNKALLFDAIQRLEKGEEEQEGELKAENPSSDERRLEDIDNKIKKRKSSRNLATLGAPIEEISSHDDTSMSISSESYRENPPSSDGERNSTSSMIRKPSNPQHQISRPQKSGIQKIKQGDDLDAEEFKMPLIEVEVTKEGCTPRIDLQRSKVIIQTRSIARTNGSITHETQCTDSHLIFDIKKDYGCCSDIVDQQASVAYTTFKRYWIDESDNKIYVDDHCLKDESQPHPFIEEKGLCPHDIDLQSRLAYPQGETVYYDRNNARKLVNACHRTSAQPLFIILTEQGCSLKHKYEENRSIIQKRNIFIENGITHEVTPCHETNEAIAHKFVKAGCKPSVNGSTVIPMAKRQISYKDKTKIISGQCEPQDLTNLILTKEGCEGQYEHDFESARSYPLIKGYYQWEEKKRFIDKSCRRSNEPIPHLVSIIGYENLDQELKCKPRYQISIQDQTKKYIIREMTENNENKWIPYTLKESIEKPSQKRGPSSQGSNVIFENDKVEIWIRPDGTVFEKFIGVGSSSSISIAPNDGSGKTIVSVTEQCNGIFNWAQLYGKHNKWGDRVDYYVRKLTTYSDGSVKVGGWEVRVSGSTAEEDGNKMKTRRLYGEEPDLPPGIMYKGGD